MMQLIGFIGAMLILVAYVSHQLKRMDPDKPAYNLINAIGAAILTYVALSPFQLGFVVLEGTWTVVSLAALYKAMTRISPPAQG
ncbi:MAG: hypothetical protein HYX26_01645 [Acidobacteriales bacterium]|nr:hypothetical protein [Terriglobales bacterium]